MIQLKEATSKVTENASATAHLLDSKLQEAERHAAQWKTRAMDAEETLANEISQIARVGEALAAACAQAEDTSQKSAAVASEAIDTGIVLSLMPVGANSPGGASNDSQQTLLIAQLSEAQVGARSLHARNESLANQVSSLEDVIAAHREQLLGSKRDLAEANTVCQGLEEKAASLSIELAACRQVV